MLQTQLLEHVIEHLYVVVETYQRRRIRNRVFLDYEIADGADYERELLPRELAAVVD